MYFILVISKMSDINQSSLPISILSKYALGFENINAGRCFLILFAKTLEINFATMLSRVIGLQFLINLMSLSLFP